jgi:hypothetical protein
MIRGPLRLMLIGYSAIALSTFSANAAQTVDLVIDPTSALPALMSHSHDEGWQYPPYRLPISEPAGHPATWPSGNDEGLKSGASGGALRSLSLLVDPAPNSELRQALAVSQSGLALLGTAANPDPVPLPASLWLFVSSAAILMALLRRSARANLPTSI